MGSIICFIPNLLKFCFAAQTAWKIALAINSGHDIFQKSHPSNGSQYVMDPAVLQNITELSTKLDTIEKNIVQRLDKLDELIMNLPSKIQIELSKNTFRKHIAVFYVLHTDLSALFDQRNEMDRDAWNTLVIPKISSIQDRLDYIRIDLVTYQSTSYIPNGLIMDIAKDIAVSIIKVINVPLFFLSPFLVL